MKEKGEIILEKLESLKEKEKMIGIKQAKRAVADNRADTVFLAEDAESRLIAPVQALCEESGVPVVMVSTMRLLGEACGIEVGAAAAVLLK